MTVKLGHVQVWKSLRGVSEIGGKLGIVDVACRGEDGSEMGGIKPTSLEDDCSGDNGGSLRVGIIRPGGERL